MKSRVVVKVDKALDDCQGAHHQAIDPFPELLVQWGGLGWLGKERTHLPASNVRGEDMDKVETMYFQARVNLHTGTREVICSPNPPTLTFEG